MNKTVLVSVIIGLLVFGQAFCQDKDGLKAEQFISSEVSPSQKVEDREIILPIEIEIERNLDQVLASGEGAFFMLNENDLYVQGRLDASRYYTGYKGAGTGTLITSLLSPLVGLIPAIATSSSSPNEENLGYPDVELIKQREYYDSYTHQAKKIKQKKVWTNWAIGFGVNLVGVLILLN